MRLVCAYLSATWFDAKGAGDTEEGRRTEDGVVTS